MAIQYTDGRKTESRILKIVSGSPDLRSLKPVGGEHYDTWAIRYHLSPERANLLRHLDFRGLDVLELGAGMGAVSRFLAEEAKSLTVVEGTEARYSALKARLRDLNNWSGQVANIQDAKIDKRFDVVCVIGVLEYSELYVRPPADFQGSPFAYFLAMARRWLKPEGVLILAIENRLGLKYWSGSAEDHTRRTFDGICGYGDGPTARTFSRRELTGLLREAGLASVDEQLPFPDYKIPAVVIDGELAETRPSLAAELASGPSFDNYDLPRVKYFPDPLAAQGVASAGLLPELSNSFLMIATASAQSPVRAHLLRRKLEGGELAWYYAPFRKVPTKTAFTRGLRVRKAPLVEGDASQSTFTGPSLEVAWQPSPEEPVVSERKLRETFLRKVYFDGAEPAFTLLVDFLRWSLKEWSLESGKLSGRALDAVVGNAAVLGEGRYRCFDLEWDLTGSLEPSWFVLRNVLSVGKDRESFPTKAPFRTLTELYEALCETLEIPADLEGGIRREAELQSLVTNRTSFEFHRASLSRFLKSSWIPAGYPRTPRLEERLFRSLFYKETMRNARRAANLGIRTVRWLRRLGSPRELRP